MVEHDDSIKLLLEAFQMSVSACLAHPTVSMLGEQLQGRLQLSRKSCRVGLLRLILMEVEQVSATQQYNYLELMTDCTVKYGGW